jgi:hypothetical protein
MVARRFSANEVIVRREILDGGEWLVYPVRVVEDTVDLLAVYLAQGTPLTFGDGEFRWGPHPWTAFEPFWQSEGVLQLQRPGDGYAVWARRSGGEFTDWYVNFQEPMRRTDRGLDTLDQELDLLLPADGSPYRSWISWIAAPAGGNRGVTGGRRKGGRCRTRYRCRTRGSGHRTTTTEPLRKRLQRLRRLGRVAEVPTVQHNDV